MRELAAFCVDGGVNAFMEGFMRGDMGAWEVRGMMGLVDRAR